MTKAEFIRIVRYGMLPFNLGIVTMFAVVLIPLVHSGRA